MKTVVILLGIFFACVAAQTEYPMITNFTRSYEACSKSMNPSNETMKILQADEYFDNKEANCFVACLLNQIGIMKDGKVNFERAEEFLKSGREDPARVDEMLKMIKTDCQTDADASKDECTVAGRYAKCFKEVKSKMAADYKRANVQR